DAGRPGSGENKDVLRPLLRPGGLDQCSQQRARGLWRVERTEIDLLANHHTSVGKGGQRLALTRRHTERGRRRNTIATHRNTAGTHTISLPEASASAMASATASGVVAKGAGSRPVVIFERTNPGRTMTTRTPEPTRASPRPCANASSPALEEP